MTGYASVATPMENGEITVDIRSVNHRFLDIQIRTPEELRNIEITVRECIKAKLKRGKIDCRIFIKNKEIESGILNINKSVFEQLKQLDREIRKTAPSAKSMSVNDFLNWPSFLQEKLLNDDELVKVTKETTNTALEQLIAMRVREGNRLGVVLRERLHDIVGIITNLEQRLPQIIQNNKEKLNRRIEDAKAIVSEDRLNQEIVFLIGKMDIDEELQRVKSHVTEFYEILSKEKEFKIRNRSKRFLETSQFKSTNNDIFYFPCSLYIRAISARSNT